LRWFAQQKIDAFVDWQRIEHPDFPGREVELGGFKPFLRWNPPASEVGPLAQKHWQFLRKFVDLLPRLDIPSVKVEPLHGSLWRITAVVVNEGYLPTMPQMGAVTRWPYPLQIALELSEGASLVTGHARSRLPILAGSGGRVERAWLVAVPEGKPASVRIRAWSPSVGTVAKRVALSGQSKQK